MNYQTNIDLLEKEYFHLQTQVEKFDEKSLTIKAWSVTLAASIAGSSSFSDNYILILFASITSIMFWIIDASWKNFQYSYYKRIWEIEKFMRDKDFQIDNLQIATNWSKSFRQGGTKRFIKILFWRHIVFPHGIMSALLMSLYLIIKNCS